MKKRNFGLFVFLLLLPLFFSINVSGVSNVNYNFNQNTLLDISTPDIDQEFNLRDVSVFQFEYNGTYGFNNETVDTNSTDIGFIGTDNSGINCLPIIQFDVGSQLDAHRKILALIDNNNSGTVHIVNDFASQIFGTIELWIRSTNVATQTAMTIRSGLSLVVRLRISGGFFFYNPGGGGWTTTGARAIADDWIHVKIDFESGAGGYKSLASDTWRIHVNGTQYGDFTYESAVASLDNLRLDTDTAASAYTSYFDGIDYSWDNLYYNGRNMIPLLETRPLRKEVKRAEFSLKEPNEFYISTDTKYDGFDKVETSNGLVVPIADPNDVNDRILSFSVQGGGDVAGIEKTNLGLTGFTFINTKMEASVQTMAGAGGGRFRTLIYDIDGFLAGGFGFDLVNLTSFNIDVRQSGASWTTIAYTMNPFDIIEIDHYIDYETQTQITDIYINSTFINRTINDLAQNGLSGLNQHQTRLTNSAVAGSVNLDSLGVYIMTNSITDGLGYAVVNVGSKWIVENHNLFTRHIAGFVHIASTEGYYQVEHFPDTFSELESFQEFSNVSQFENVYFSGLTTTNNFSFVFTINSSSPTPTFEQFSISRLLIQGVSLNQQNNVYNLRMTFGNISVNDNFFFVENSQLKFTHTSNDNNSLEFIQATFDIDNFLSEQKGISFKSEITNRAEGNFTVEFTSGVQNIPLSLLSITQRIELTDSKTINRFIVLITDNNDNNITGITSGFVGNIIIFPNTDLLPNFLIFSLLGMLIPLIIILIPTIALRELYGTALVIPIFLLMSFILLFGGILPIWLIFIIVVSSSLFILKKDKGTID